MRIIDVHTHAFPDALAGRTMDGLVKCSGPYKPYTDGTVGGLLASMDEAGVYASFILNIATKPKQAGAIRGWAKEIASERILPLGSVHPESGDWQSELAAFKADGIKGVKLHPMYQAFAVDERRMFPVYEAIAAAGMFVIFHAGVDIAFPGSRNSSVDKIRRVINNFPSLKIIAAHFGGWKEWTEVYEHLCGQDVFIETSFIHEVDGALRDKILLGHDRNRFLFGTDCPWGSQKEQVQVIRELKAIDEGFKEKIFCGNVKYLA